MSNTSKENVKHNCGAAYMAVAIVGLVFAVLSAVLYEYVPVSDIANSIEHSAKDGLYLLALSPVCALVAAVAYIVGGLLDKALVKNSVVQLVIFIVSAVLLVFTFAVSVAMFFNQLSMGFVAPLDGTVWSSLGKAVIASVVLYAAGNMYIFATARK